MTSSIRIAPPNSIVVITGGRTRSLPNSFEPGQGFAATPASVAIGCFTEVDGETNIALGPPPQTSSRPAFTGSIETPHGYVAVWTVEWKKLLEMRVPTARTKIRIWTNHPTEPNEVFIGIGE